MSKISIFGKKVPVFRRGMGNIPLLILGQASLFRKEGFLPEQMDGLFTIYFVDIFEKLDAAASTMDYSHLTLEDFVKVVNDIIKFLGLSQVALFAHSAAGVLACKFSETYPEKILFSIIVATAPAWGIKKDQAVLEYFKLNAEEERQEIFKEDQAALIKAKLPISFTQAYNARRAQFFYNPIDVRWKKLWDGINQDAALVEQYFKLIIDFKFSTSVKTAHFLALGLYDFSNPFYSTTEDLNKKDRQVAPLGNFFQPRNQKEPLLRYYIFEKSGHYPFIEESELFMNTLTDFIKQVNPDSSSFIQSRL